MDRSPAATGRPEHALDPSVAGAEMPFGACVLIFVAWSKND
jgi:hypothetical protein